MRQPVLRPAPGQEKYVLSRDFAAWSLTFDIYVPAGFVYDGASIPAVAWQAIHSPFNPRVMCAAVVHDWLYYTHQISREAADQVFHDLLLRNRVGDAKAFLMFQAVRTAGGFYWENDPDDLRLLRRLFERHRTRPDWEKFGFPAEVVAAAA